MEWISQILQHLGNHALLQGLLAAFVSLLLEDPTTIACGLLVADDQMLFLTAYLGICFGIAFGDFTLYWLGRAVGPKTVQWRLVSPDRLDRVRVWFNRNMIITVLVARFIPGMRLPTYVGAGIFKASAVRFLGLALLASLTWTLLLLLLTVNLGRAIFPMLGRFKWPVALTLLAAFITLQWLLARRHARNVSQERPDAYRSPVSLFEFWPSWLFYIPSLLIYFYYSVRFYGLTLPTAVNPSIYAGGLLGDAKSELLGLVPGRFREQVAPWARIELPDPPVPMDEQLRLAEVAMRRAALTYPLVAKPDVGHRGAGVQPLRNEEQLRQYLEAFPAGKPLLLQQLCEQPGEAAIVYFRRPGEAQGHIFSLTFKHFPSVTGDGHHSVRELIMHDDRAAIIHDIYFRRHRRQLERVLAKGETFPLVFTGNHRLGAVLKSGNDQITPELCGAIDELAQALPEFYYGRFEVRFNTAEDLLQARDFTIFEINGSGAEALHIWDANMTLLEAWRVQAAQWRLLFEIGALNRRRGHRPLAWRALWREAKAHFHPPIHYPPAQ